MPRCTIVRNPVENAINYTQPGGDQAAAEGAMLVITVSDNGPHPARKT
jgi:signal transduction histidine kinase